jgi:hypothetical protein
MPTTPDTDLPNKGTAWALEYAIKILDLGTMGEATLEEKMDLQHAAMILCFIKEQAGCSEIQAGNEKLTDTIDMAVFG